MTRMIDRQSTVFAQYEIDVVMSDTAMVEAFPMNPPFQQAVHETHNPLAIMTGTSTVKTADLPRLGIDWGATTDIFPLSPRLLFAPGTS